MRSFIDSPYNSICNIVNSRILSSNFYYFVDEDTQSPSPNALLTITSNFNCLCCPDPKEEIKENGKLLFQDFFL